MNRSHPARHLASKLICIGLLSLIGATAAHPALAQAPVKQRFTIGTGPAGAGFYEGGIALSSLIKLKLMPGTGIDLDPVETAGAADNIRGLDANQIQFAIIDGLTAHYARTGTGALAGERRQDQLRVVTALWPSVMNLLVKKPRVQSGTVEDLAALDPTKLALGLPGTADYLANREVLGRLGVPLADGSQPVPQPGGDLPDALASGRIEAIGAWAGPPAPPAWLGVEQLADDVALLGFTEAQIAKADGGFGLFAPYPIPAGTYPGQEREVMSVAEPTLLVARADLPDGVVYQVTKAIFDNLTLLANIHPSMASLKLDTALAQLPLPLHPGAARFFKEAGLPVPEIANLEVAFATDGVDLADPQAARAALNQGLVGVIQGDDSTAAQIAGDLAATLDNAALRVVAIRGKGAVTNVPDLLYLKGVDVGVVPADVLEYARQQPALAAITAQLNYLSVLYPQELHLLVGPEIKTIRDLVGRKVNFGLPASASQVTAAILFNGLSLAVERTSFDDGMALEKLRRGELSGLVLTGGKPLPLLRALPADIGLHLLAVPPVEFAGVYRPAELTASDYPGLVPPDQPIGTIATQAVLMTYAWPPESPRYAPIAGFVGSFFQALPSLQVPGRHPKWREVDPRADLTGWQRSPIAAAALAQLPTTPAAPAAPAPAPADVSPQGGPAEPPPAASAPGAPPPPEGAQPVSPVTAPPTERAERPDRRPLPAAAEERTTLPGSPPTL